MASILVGNVMSKTVVSVAPTASVTDVVALMRQRSYSCMVIADQGRPTGIITERDVLKLANLLLSGTDATQLKASGIMTQPITTIRNSATLAGAMALCKEKNIRHLPVVNADGMLCGILTQSDLINGFLQTIEQNTSSVADQQEMSGDIGDGIPDVDLDTVERDLKNIFHSMHTSKNPQGANRLQSRFI